MSGIKPIFLVVGVVAVLAVSSLAVSWAMAAPPLTPSQDGARGPTYNVTFSETGLASGTNWSVSVWGGDSPWAMSALHRESSNGSTIVFALSNGTYSYRIDPVAGYTITSNDSRGSFQVTGASPPSVAVTFTSIPAYSVTCSESGLASGTNWSVSVFGQEQEDGSAAWGPGPTLTESSTTSQITFTLPNGTFGYFVHRVPGYTLAANQSHGDLNISGSATTVNVGFVKLATYPVTFTETGLALGTNWTVTAFPLGEDSGGMLADVQLLTESSNTSTLTFSLPNGTYGFFVHRVPGYLLSENSSHGAFNVSGLVGVSIDVAFTYRAVFPVTFVETGLAPGTNWSVAVVARDGQGDSGASWEGFGWTTATSNGTQIVLSLPNGTYGYLVFRVAGYTIAQNESRGMFNVSGSPGPTIGVTFLVMSTFPVTFTETGLAVGTNWSVTVFSFASGDDSSGDGGFGSFLYTASSNGSSLSLSLPNGTYGFFVHHVSGYLIVNGSFGEFNVSGSGGVASAVTFSPGGSDSAMAMAAPLLVARP